jgi:transposase
VPIGESKSARARKKKGQRARHDLIIGVVGGLASSLASHYARQGATHLVDKGMSAAKKYAVKKNLAKKFNVFKFGAKAAESARI